MHIPRREALTAAFLHSHQGSHVPLVSVGVPTFNRREKLERCLRSILEQDYPRLEVVVSDNASPDDTAQFLREMAQRDTRLVVAVQSKNQGPVENFRQVRSMASGEFFMWLPDDDWIDQSYISSCVAALLEDPSLSLVAGQAWLHGPDGAVALAPIDLVEAAPDQRVLEHFRTVGHNSALFGVMRGEFAQAIMVPNGVGADWLIMAQLAAWGRIRTLSSPNCHRSAGGVSRSMEELTRYFGHKGRQARNPWAYMARRTFCFLVGRSPAFKGIPLIRRLIMSTRVVAPFLFREWIRSEWKHLRPRFGIVSRTKRVLGRWKGEGDLLP